MQTRDSFLVFTRKQVARKYKNEKDIEKFSFLSRLAAKSKIFRAIFKCLGRERKYCLSCGLEGAKEDMFRFTHCVNCQSPYCNDCFEALKNVCTACMNPVDYGDIDGISVEYDSSEDEQDTRSRVRSIKERKQKLARQREERDPKKVLLAFQKRFTQKEGDDVKVSKLGEDTDSDDTEGGTSTSYDTDYQHVSAPSSSEEGEESLLSNKKRKRTDKVSMEIFGDN
ncbi:DC-STAMP domain-containing protein 2 [Plakobranchus ocellatus]|uniref:DC-STAMP domain-containing protein 2 n=1 Tax=Plakobranchus ocellatus TaxID=259542 RepID=A0AAV4B7E0_9GAST|nr:DC-STAMP domain-containing protein 2 [Plakobranchus ocellatus]